MIAPAWIRLVQLGALWAAQVLFFVLTYTHTGVRD